MPMRRKTFLRDKPSIPELNQRRLKRSHTRVLTMSNPNMKRELTDQGINGLLQWFPNVFEPLPKSR